MKHYARTKSLQSLAGAVPTAGPSDSCSSAPPTASKPGVRVPPETRLLWQLGDAMSASTSFEAADGFGPVPLTAGADVVPLTQPKARAVPVDVMYVTADALVQGVYEPTPDTAALDFQGGGKKPVTASALKRPKTVKPSVPVYDVSDSDEGPPEDEGNDFVDIGGSVMAAGTPSVGSVASGPTGGAVAGSEACWAKDDWVQQRRRVVIVSQTSYVNSGHLLQELKPNFVILYDPDPGVC